jgi:hypothetical protein
MGRASATATIPAPLAGDKPRLDRLAETDIVCDQKIDARES